MLVLNKDTGLETFSKHVDSVTAEDKSTSLIGGYYDATFGKTLASASFQITRVTTAENMPTLDQVDSLILVLPYGDEYFGSINQSITLRLYELLDDISLPEELEDADTTIYYSDTTFNVSSEELASYSFWPEPDSVVVIDSIDYDPHIRFPITNTAFIQRLLDEDADDDVDFIQEVLKGFYLTSDVPESADEGLLLGLDILGSAYMNLYFTSEEGSSAAKRYNVSSNLKCVNQYTHFDYADAAPQFIEQVMDGNEALGQEKFYVQGTAGIVGYIRLSGLDAWIESIRDKNIGVNDAALVLYAEDYEGLDLPKQLIILREDGEEVSVDVAKNEGGRFVFHLPELIQSIVQGELENVDLKIYVNSASLNPSRAVFYGGNADEMGAELRIIYTEI